MTTTITSLPTIPQRSASSTFPARVDALLSAFESEFQPDLNSWIDDVNTSKTEIESHLSNTTSQVTTTNTNQASVKTNAQTGNTNAGISVWVSGTTYAIDVLVYSPLNLRLYRRLTAGAGTTDPSVDFTNWELSAREFNLNLPSIQPSIRLNFFAGVLDSRVTFTRASSGTFINKRGLIELAPVNTPRFDYDPSTLVCKGLLVEESRTNLFTYSDQFNNAAWSKLNSSITANNTTAPDGTVVADLLTATSTRGNVYVVATSAAENRAMSVYVKGTASTFQLQQYESGFAAGSVATFNLSTGVVSSVSNYGATSGSVATISALTNGWFRCTLTVLNTAATWVYVIETAQIDPVHIYGAQLEAGAFPSSYIPTAGSSVTRSADNASMTGVNFSSWFRQDEGTVLVKSQTMTSTGNSFAIQISDNSYNNRIVLGQNSANATGQVIVSAATTLDSAGPSRTSNTIKQSFTYRVNDGQLYQEGTAGTTDSSGAVNTALTRLDLGSDHAGSSRLNGWLSYFVFYPKRITNLESQSVSTY